MRAARSRSRLRTPCVGSRVSGSGASVANTPSFSSRNVEDLVKARKRDMVLRASSDKNGKIVLDVSNLGSHYYPQEIIGAFFNALGPIPPSPVEISRRAVVPAFFTPVRIFGLTPSRPVKSSPAGSRRIERMEKDRREPRWPRRSPLSAGRGRTAPHHSISGVTTRSCTACGAWVHGSSKPIATELYPIS